MMARVSDRLVVQLVEDRIVVLDESSGTEVVVPKRDPAGRTSDGHANLLRLLEGAEVRGGKLTIGTDECHVVFRPNEVSVARQAVEYLTRFTEPAPKEPRAVIGEDALGELARLAVAARTLLDDDTDKEPEREDTATQPWAVLEDYTTWAENLLAAIEQEVAA